MTFATTSSTKVPPEFSQMGVKGSSDDDDERKRSITTAGEEDGDDDGVVQDNEPRTKKTVTIQTSGKNRRFLLLILGLLLLLCMIFFFIQDEDVSEYISSLCSSSSSSSNNPNPVTSSNFIEEKTSNTKTSEVLNNAQPPQKQKQHWNSISKAPEIQSMQELPSSSNGLPQYSITRRIDKDASIITINNTIPKNMMLLDDKLLWCPNAKAGTTSMYFSIIFPMNFTSSKGMKRNQRCYFSNGCPISARVIYDRDGYTERKVVMSAPSFTIVRNPWDRIRSCYEGKIQTKHLFNLSPDHPRGDSRTGDNMKGDQKDLWTQQKMEAKVMTFVEFVNHVTNYPMANIHWMPHSMNCLTVKDEYQQIFHYDHIIKIEDGMFPQVEAIFDLYNVPYPNGGDLQAMNTMHETTTTISSSSSSNNNNDSAPTTTTTTTGSIRGDERLITFYREAASLANITMEELIERVRSIYEYDVKLYNYAFPSYQ